MIEITYIIRCTDNSCYCGITKNLSRALTLHKKEKGKSYFARRGKQPFKLIFAIEGRHKRDISRMGIDRFSHLLRYKNYLTPEMSIYLNKVI